MSDLKPGDVVRGRGTLRPLMTIVRPCDAITSHVCWVCCWTNADGRACTRAFVASMLEPYAPVRQREREPA
jgi:hypothetical protein